MFEKVHSMLPGILHCGISIIGGKSLLRALSTHRRGLRMSKRKSSTKDADSKEETMTDAILSKISDDFLECTICLEPFKDPRVLPCLHTFCEGCLKKFVAQDKVKSKFSCPTCRTETVLPKGGVPSFKNNFFVQSLSDTVQTHKTLVSKEDGKVQCDVCEEEVASQGCVVCEEFLCDECACAHHRAKRTRSHEVIGVAELKKQLITKAGSLKSKSLPTCPKHDDEKLKFYCETCKHPICRDCWVLQHKDHKYMYLPDAAGSVREEIKGKLEAARQKIAEYQDKASTVAKKQAELDTRSKKAEDDIDAAAEEKIKQYIRSKQTELKEKLASITATRSKQLSATADSVESSLGCLSSTVEFSQKVVEHGSDFDVLNMYSDVTARLESLLDGPSPDIPDDISYVMFDPRKEKGVILGNVVDKEVLEEEESRAEATFRFTIEDFSKVEDIKLSPATIIQNLPWMIVAGNEQTPNSQLANTKTLCFYLKSDADSKGLWSCRASVEFRLIPQKIGVATYQKESEHIFYKQERECGFPNFMPWHEVCDPQKGYIKDDKIILEAYVKAEAPRGEKELILSSIDDEEMQEKTEGGHTSQPEATFRFTVKNFSKVMRSKVSPTVFIRNLPWKIAVYPEDNQESNSKTLGVYLQCHADSVSVWSCRASVELRLIPQKEGVEVLKVEFEHVFYCDSYNWGFPDFIPWDEVCNPIKGYIKDDTVILEAYVKANVPRGMKELIIGNLFSEEVLEKVVDKEDESRAEATFRFTVENFSTFTVKTWKHSPIAFIRNLPWRIGAWANHDPDSQLPNNKSLAVQLVCDADTNSKWSCHTSVEFRLIPQTSDAQIHSMQLENVFYNDEYQCGFDKFMPWHEVCDPQKGYIKDDKIILEAHVKADAPHIFACGPMRFG
ncbi:uncharacterized protein LOC118427512 [Branchiostoma floridae]|uniref:Uncharacterized protein LOC118427512 n=1 Tax=Branchiostoma floridae TaxID=7739 RepID=A0A9J7N4T1_BRAFL|nr:uncharacterized protein LOC118427512 [Branchiostoma floridae]